MGYGKIITVVDQHSASAVIARYAMTMAAKEGADLVLYAVHDHNTDESTLRCTERHMEQLFEDALAMGIAVSRISESGSPRQLLPRRVDAEGCDLLFYPLSPGEKYGATLQGHDVHSLLRSVRADMAIMQAIQMGRAHPRRILIPLGRAIREPHKRVRFIAAFAKSFGASVTLFHLTGGSLKQEMPDEIRSFRKELKLHHIEVEERTGTGHIAKSIAIEAITRHNDLIIVGASERSLLKRLFAGNPAGEVMHSPPCNTILFRPGDSTP